MNTPKAPSWARRAAVWLARKAALAVPGVLLAKLTAAIDTLLDSRAPAWRRAIAAAVLIELVELIPSSIPASLALRVLVLRSVFETVHDHARERVAR